MKIVYTDHLLIRLKLRDIPHNLPKEIYLNPEEILFDNHTSHFVALAKKNYLGKERLLMVAFDKYSARVELVTIHPLLEKDRDQRIGSGRWVKQ